MHKRQALAQTEQQQKDYNPDIFLQAYALVVKYYNTDIFLFQAVIFFRTISA